MRTILMQWTLMPLLLIAVGSTPTTALAEIAAGWDVAITPEGIGEGPLVGTGVQPGVSITSGSPEGGDVDLNGVVVVPDIGDGSSNNVPGAFVVQNWVQTTDNPDPYVGFAISSDTALDLSTFELVVRRERINTPSRIREISAAFSTDGVNFTPFVFPSADGLGATIGGGRNGPSVREPEAIDTNVLTADELKIWNLEQFAGAQQLYVRVQAAYTGDPDGWNPNAVLFFDDRGDFDTDSILVEDTNTNNHFQPGLSSDGLDVIVTTADRWAGGSGDWNSNNWAAGTGPEPTWDAVLSNSTSSSAQTVEVNSDSEVRAVKINGTTGKMAVDVKPEVTLSSQDIVQVGEQGQLNVDGEVSTLSVQVADGGILTGNGEVSGSLKNAGVVAPGNSAGSLYISGDYRQTTDGELQIELGGTSAGSDYDQLVVVGTAWVEGSLEVDLLPSYRPAGGESWSVVSAGEVAVGMELDATATRNRLGVDFELTHTESQEVLQATKAYVPGDVDFDDDIDTADSTTLGGAWTGALLPGQGSRDWIDGDFDNDDDVDSADSTMQIGNWTGAQSSEQSLFAAESELYTFLAEADVVVAGAASLIYDPQTGNVMLDPTTDPVGSIISFVLGNGDNSFVAPGTAMFPFINTGTNTDDTAFQIGQTDVLNIGFIDVFDLGNIFPTGMSQGDLESYLTLAFYAPELGGGTQDFVLVAVPEPSTYVLALLAVGCIVPRLLRRKNKR